MTPRYAVLLLVLLLPACGKLGRKKPPPPPPQQLQHNPVLDMPEAYADKDGLVSMTFHVEKFIPPEQYGAGATHMTLAARHRYVAMRFDLIVGLHGEAFQSWGATGDQFLGVLDDLFGTSLKPRTMRVGTDFSHQVLEGDPTQLNKGPVKLLERHANGAQFLLLVDWKAKTVELREIDKKYRRQIIEAFRL